MRPVCKEWQRAELRYEHFGRIPGTNRISIQLYVLSFDVSCCFKTGQIDHCANCDTRYLRHIIICDINQLEIYMTLDVNVVYIFRKNKIILDSKTA